MGGGPLLGENRKRDVVFRMVDVETPLLLGNHLLMPSWWSGGRFCLLH